MKTIWRWLLAPVEHVGLSDGAIAMAAGGLLGWVTGAIVKWLIS